MSKNLIKQPAIRAALIATGNVKPSETTIHRLLGYKTPAESQAAAIAARRKELGVKPVVIAKQRVAA